MNNIYVLCEASLMFAETRMVFTHYSAAEFNESVANHRSWCNGQRFNIADAFHPTVL